MSAQSTLLLTRAPQQNAQKGRSEPRSSCRGGRAVDRLNDQGREGASRMEDEMLAIWRNRIGPRVTRR
jgi:hypothetical protein